MERRRQGMKLSVLTSYLESLAPLAWQESYDNSGLIVGDSNQDVDAALISLDCTEAVIEEAIQTNCNLVISHHPIVFKGLKRFNGNNHVERVVMKAIKNDIAIYAIHTNLDNYREGVNGKIAERLNLKDTKVLSPKNAVIKQLVVYVPEDHASRVRSALFEAGAGKVGKYEECSFNTMGMGTFTPVEGSNPYSGKLGKQEQARESRIEVVFHSYLEKGILSAMYESHPYEEVAHSVLSMDNRHKDVGAGLIGELEGGMTEAVFLAYLKERLNTQLIRHTALMHKQVKKVAVCGGAGSFLLKEAIGLGADAFVTADFKYHEFFDAEDKILVNDIGHFESEQFTQELLMEIIQKKFPNFAVRLTEVNTNPINYYF